jgi:3-oxoadipate CoA-transferase alpha subunit
MIDKTVESLREAVSVIGDGAIIHISGFGESGNPTELAHALIDQGARDLTLVNNNAGNGHVGLAALLESGQVRKMICSFPRSSHSVVFETMYRERRIELDVVPQGTLAERIRAAGAGIGGFYTRTTIGTPLAEGKEVRDFAGLDYVLEEAIYGDVALVKAAVGDRWGNLTYTMSSRNFNPVMAMGATNTIAQVGEIVDLGGITMERRPRVIDLGRHPVEATAADPLRQAKR